MTLTNKERVCLSLLLHLSLNMNISTSLCPRVAVVFGIATNKYKSPSWEHVNMWLGKCFVFYFQPFVLSPPALHSSVDLVRKARETRKSFRIRMHWTTSFILLLYFVVLDFDFERVGKKATKQERTTRRYNESGR